MNTPIVRQLELQLLINAELAQRCAELSSSEKKYRQIVEISPNAIFIQQNEMLVYANNSALKLLGATNLDKLLEHSFCDFFPPNYQKIVKKYRQKNKNKAAMQFLEGKLINLKGDAFDVEMIAFPVVYEEKPAICMIVRDITERKQSVLYLEIQYTIAWILAESTSLFISMGKILKIICECLQWDCGVIWVVNQESKKLRCARVWQMPKVQNDIFQQTCKKLTFEAGVNLPGRVWKTRKAIWKTNIFHDKSFLRENSIVEMGLNTAIAFPIVYENKVLGVFEFFSKDILPANDNFLLWFESVGRQLGIFLKRKNMEKQMLYLAEHDILTGLPNRYLLEKYLETALLAAENHGKKVAVLFLDLDNLKYLNDSMGHQSGDFVLQEVSKRFRRCLKEGDTISRYGGDEFIIILPDVKQKKDVIKIITRLQNQLSKQSLLQEKEFFMTASIGVSFYPDDGETAQALIKSADIALYVAKERGRNTFQFCTPEMRSKAENRGVLLNDLGRALEKKEFLLYYQPKIDVLTRKITGMEALIRWKRANCILLPDSFIPIAEDSELITPITEWVLKTACLQNKAWQTTGLPPVTVSINLSVRNLNKRLLRVMETTLTEVGLDPHFFEVELTESVLMYNVESNIQILQSLKDMGLKISIDDVGTGYSSLSYLKRLPIDIIKIDQSFIKNIATDQSDKAIVTAIVAMAHSLGYKVVAEGVETEFQLKFLSELGCNEIQGYYFSRPLPPLEAADFISKNC